MGLARNECPVPASPNSDADYIFCGATLQLDCDDTFPAHSFPCARSNLMCARTSPPACVNRVPASLPSVFWIGVPTRAVLRLALEAAKLAAPVLHAFNVLLFDLID